MKLYINYPDDKGEGIYDLIAETGEHLAGHFCSSYRFAEGDLITGRPERIKEYTERFGSFKVVWLGQDEMTRDKLFELNKQWCENKAREEK